ncbi:carboxymuconolactone decarboxylase family protein [Actinacidiphila yeochonensis]|uniref:carboxymuconolactone decarboxylase family protein n=1 Tax=Actinacidiphila yeochonensis TaxID=89050 RepID=UPI0007C6C5B2
MGPNRVELTDDVLFGDVRERPGLSQRHRGLVTVGVLAALYRPGPEQLGLHLRPALDDGLSPAELGEAVTRLAFQAGWPSAMTAAGQLHALVADADADPAPDADADTAGGAADATQDT